MSTNTVTGAAITSRDEFDKDNAGQYKYWAAELEASQKMLKGWHDTGDRVNDRYLGRYGSNAGENRTINLPNRNGFRLNLFHSNVTTLLSMMYANTPKIDVSRRFADAKDDTARVAAEMMERLLNLDMAENGEEVDNTLRSALQDRLLPGLGCAKVRYEVETKVITEAETETDEDGNTVTVKEAEEEIVSEEAPIEYWFWGDVLWSWARHWSDVRWLAYRNFLTKDQVRDRWGDEAAENLTYKQQTTASDEDSTKDPIADNNAWLKAEVWEVWDKEKRQVVYLSFGGYKQILETKEDPLGLSGFFPSPPFLLANQTTTLYMPTPDFKLAEDLYNEIDILQTRITKITSAVRVSGVYDQKANEIGRMLEEGTDNTLIPVENWAMFAEGGGTKGKIDWFPIQDVVNTLDKLRQLRSENIALLQQVTGMADIMRGELGNQYEGVGQSKLKAKFGSVRVQALQEQFAQFASDLMQLKAEVICKHFDGKTIVKLANMQYSFDDEPDLIAKAVALLKQPEMAHIRVAIRSESVAMVDYTSLQEERSAFLNALSTFMQSSAPLMEADPNATPFLLQLLQWGLSGFKGAQEIEGVIDKAIESALEQQKAKQGQADPAVMEQQGRIFEQQQKTEGELAKVQAKAAADVQIREVDMNADMNTAIQEHELKMAEIQAQTMAEIFKIEAKKEADLAVERAQYLNTIAQQNNLVEGEIQKDVVNAQLEMEKIAESSANSIAETMATAEAKIKETTIKARADQDLEAKRAENKPTSETEENDGA